MTLMEKFAKLTPEQREKLNAVKDEAALIAFAAENGIELTEQDKRDALAYFESGVLPMSEDDMDAVAGGAAAKKTSPAKAAADGRLVPMPHSHYFYHPFSYCSCHHDNKWAREVITTTSGYDANTVTHSSTYIDIKCYKCNKQWSKITI